MIGEAAGSAEPPAHSAQDEDRGDPHHEVQHDDCDEGDPDPGVGGGRVLDLHEPVDDPRLAADLGHDPAGLHADHGQDPEAAAARRNHLLAGILRRNTQLAPYHTDNRNSSVPSPTMTSQARWTMLT